MSGPVRLLRRAVRFELDGWRSLATWTRRRVGRAGPAPDEREFAYTAPLVPLIWVLTGVSVLEVVALELLVPWDLLSDVLLVLGVWGVLVVLGVAAALVVHPHVVDASGLRVRHGARLAVDVPWDAVAAVRAARRSRDGRTVQVDGGVLHVVVSNQTTVEVELARPVPVELPGGRAAQVSALRFHADDAAGLVAAARARLRARAD